jgi:hypothetical protein
MDPSLVYGEAFLTRADAILARAEAKALSPEAKLRVGLAIDLGGAGPAHADQVGSGSEGKVARPGFCSHVFVDARM